MVPRHQGLQARHSQGAGVELLLLVVFPHGLHLHLQHFFVGLVDIHALGRGTASRIAR